MVHIFKNVGKRSTAKNYHPLNNTNVDPLEKYGLFSDFQFGFQSSQSTPDLLTFVSDRIARDFNRSGATPAECFFHQCVNKCVYVCQFVRIDLRDSFGKGCISCSVTELTSISSMLLL